MQLLQDAKLNHKRPAGAFLLVACLVAFSLNGCSKPSYEDSGTDVPAPPTTASASDDKARQITEGLIKDIQSGNLDKVHSSFSSSLQKQMSASQLKDTVKNGFLKPLATGTNFRYEPVQMNSKGDKATVRFAFDAPEQKDWHMNLLLVQVGSQWKLGMIFPPAKSGKPMASSGAVSSQN